MMVCMYRIRVGDMRQILYETKKNWVIRPSFIEPASQTKSCMVKNSCNLVKIRCDFSNGDSANQLITFFNVDGPRPSNRSHRRVNEACEFNSVRRGKRVDTSSRRSSLILHHQSLWVQRHWCGRELDEQLPWVVAVVVVKCVS